MFCDCHLECRLCHRHAKVFLYVASDREGPHLAKSLFTSGRWKWFPGIVSKVTIESGVTDPQNPQQIFHWVLSWPSFRSTSPGHNCVGENDWTSWLHGKRGTLPTAVHPTLQGPAGLPWRASVISLVCKAEYCEITAHFCCRSVAPLSQLPFIVFFILNLPYSLTTEHQALWSDSQWLMHFAALMLTLG